MKTAVLFFLSIGLTAMFLPNSVAAQRDYFTPEEIELIRDAQAIDKRIDVLTHAIDRRFSALKIDSRGAQVPDKEKEAWGEMPQGTRFELLTDIKRILQKAIDDIDNISERPDSAIIPDKDDKRKVEGYAVIFPRAVRNLAAAVSRYQIALRTELDATKSGTDKGPILDSLDLCDQIIAAAAKLPAQAPQTTGRKH